MDVLFCLKFDYILTLSHFSVVVNEYPLRRLSVQKTFIAVSCDGLAMFVVVLVVFFFQNNFVPFKMVTKYHHYPVNLLLARNNRHKRVLISPF